MPEGGDLDLPEIGSGREDVLENLNGRIYVAVEEALQMIKEHDVICWQEVWRPLYEHFYKAATMTIPGKSGEECQIISEESFPRSRVGLRQEGLHLNRHKGQMTRPAVQSFCAESQMGLQGFLAASRRDPDTA